MVNKKQKKKVNKNNNNTSDTTDNTSSSVTKTTETVQEAAPPVLSQSSKNDKPVKVKEKEKEKGKETTNVDDDQQGEEPQQEGFKGQAGQAKKDMQAVEGYVAERAEGEGIDESKLGKALNIVDTVNEEKKRLNDQKLQKQKDAEKIKVSKEDIEFIMKEMEVTKPEADKYLRENKGDLVEALKAMVNAC
uniref:Huntingtin-interacting protein K n=1 Tax=Anthurium amnicola TaxID=1678845 RepID=A0A1D1ZEK3_9ARAE